ncbi:hypothetical protein DYB32_001556 [Aphanomyces invadans]|uniref:Uncharacterized protein n=1 Tax=Aphanomyces invadans TaxID=157072 RepID=A0A418B5Z9_9STRA|nr:hypothetical protein DYB32_001556 [Aphanomyces invadans]
MYDGFQSAFHGICPRLLFPRWVLNSEVKYGVGFLGIVLMGMLLEWWVEFQDRLQRRLVSSVGFPMSEATARDEELYDVENSTLEDKLLPVEQRPLRRRSLPLRAKAVLATSYTGMMALAYFLMLVVMSYDPLSDLLEKGDFTLEQVLEEDELIQEVKSRNIKLLQLCGQFFTNPTKYRPHLAFPSLSKEETVRKLVHYVTRKSEEDDGDMISIKYVLSVLMVRKSYEVTEVLNKNADTLLDGFMKHSVSYSIAELFKRIMQPNQGDFMDDMDFSHPYNSNGPWFSGDDDDMSAVGTPQSKGVLSWQTDRRVVDKLIENLRPTNDANEPIDSDVHKHCAEILSDIIHYGTRVSANEPAPASATLVEYIESADTVEKIINLALPIDNSYSTSMTSALTVLNIISQCLDLFFQFESVNMLHAEIESLVIGVLESGGPDLQVGLLQQSNLLERILDAYATNDAAVHESLGNAKGYMGHLLRICNMIVNITDEVKGVDSRGSLNDMTHADSIVEYLEADPSWPKWEEFVKTTIAAANEKDRHALGGSVVSHPVVPVSV